MNIRSVLKESERKTFQLHLTGSPMKIKIRSTFALGLTDSLRTEMSSGRDILLEIGAGSSVASLLRRLPSLGPAHAFDDMMMHVFVNGKLKGFDYVLQPGDVVDFHIPVSGG